MPTVKGSSKAMAMDGEMPGSAPPRMPHSTPPKDASKTFAEPSCPSATSTLSQVVIGSGPVYAHQLPTGMRTCNAWSNSAHSSGPVAAAHSSNGARNGAPASQPQTSTSRLTVAA